AQTDAALSSTTDVRAHCLATRRQTFMPASLSKWSSPCHPCGASHSRVGWAPNGSPTKPLHPCRAMSESNAFRNLGFCTHATGCVPRRVGQGSCQEPEFLFHRYSQSPPCAKECRGAVRSLSSRHRAHGGRLLPPPTNTATQAISLATETSASI